MTISNTAHGFPDCIARMEAILAEAAATIGQDDPGKLDELRSLRLKMAGAITSCQLTLDRIATDAASSPAQIAAARGSSACWTVIGREFRQFALSHQSVTPQEWPRYSVNARGFMARIRHQIAVERQLLP